ncbi:type VI secretion system baseplate subunit TssF [Aliagarivorans marinus]|uniref:type VI secretion system baseplate subunit TssF n=1 Tax=Aliagarivorans marinus TaxID=561965 RepID=UPI00041743B4|nr:type VI secretion system baseplate subunit TssF [Aliagarivorans marinus]
MDHFDSFQQELQFLRDSVEDFGQAYPAVAAELKLSAGRSADPHVEQLLQSFAYLTGKLRADMAEQRGEIPNQMLQTLYPSLVRSQPCMTVLQADVDTDGTNFLNGYTLEKGRQFVTRARSNHSDKAYDCSLQCCYNTPLWPFEISSLKILPKNYYSQIDQRRDTQAVLSVTIQSRGMDNVYEYPLDSLRFYINNNSQRPGLYQLLNDKLSAVAVKVGDDIRVIKPAANTPLLNWLGYAQDESVLPDGDGSQQAYRLLQEYFAFPDKFYFFEVSGLPLDGCVDEFELLFLLDEAKSAIQVERNSLSLNCFPAINLYPRSFKPVQLTQNHHEYRLIADENQYLLAEVYDITEVRSIGFDGVAKSVEPWLGVKRDNKAHQYYVTRLGSLLKPGHSGCDTLLSLYDTQFNPGNPIDQTLTVKGWCNNRRLPEYLRIGDALKPVGSAPMMSATVLEQPTRFKGARLQPGNNVKLLSQLSLNHFALGDGQNRLALLKQVLTLYADSFASSQMRQIEGLMSWQGESVVKRLGRQAWRGHCRGTRITMKVDEHYFGDANALLLGQVLSYFLGLYTTLNHFVQLQLVSHQREGVWKQWPPRIGEQVLL